MSAFVTGLQTVGSAAMDLALSAPSWDVTNDVVAETAHKVGHEALRTAHQKLLAKTGVPHRAPRQEFTATVGTGDDLATGATRWVLDTAAHPENLILPALVVATSGAILVGSTVGVIAANIISKRFTGHNLLGLPFALAARSNQAISDAYAFRQLHSDDLKTGKTAVNKLIKRGKGAEVIQTLITSMVEASFQYKIQAYSYLLRTALSSNALDQTAKTVATQAATNYFKTYLQSVPKEMPDNQWDRNLLLAKVRSAVSFIAANPTPENLKFLDPLLRTPAGFIFRHDPHIREAIIQALGTAPKLYDDVFIRETLSYSDKNSATIAAQILLEANLNEPGFLEDENYKRVYRVYHDNTINTSPYPSHERTVRDITPIFVNIIRFGGISGRRSILNIIHNEREESRRRTDAARAYVTTIDAPQELIELTSKGNHLILRVQATWALAKYRNIPMVNAYLRYLTQEQDVMSPGLTNEPPANQEVIQTAEDALAGKFGEPFPLPVPAVVAITDDDPTQY